MFTCSGHDIGQPKVLWHNTHMTYMQSLLTATQPVFACCAPASACGACRGQIDAMHYLADEAKLQPNMNVLFLTPCHATPYYSHIHSNISMEFLDCSPPGKFSGCAHFGTWYSFVSPAYDLV